MTKVAYLVHDLADPAAARRARMLQEGGAEVAAAGFRRSESAPARLAGARVVDLGRTFDGRLAHRASRVALRCAQPGLLRDTVLGADIVLARNLEMLALAALARRAFAPGAQLVYECLDIHRMMCGDGAVASGLRTLEGSLLDSCSSVLVSAPAFIEQYFAKHHHRLPRMLLVENKVLGQGARPQAAALRAGPPWRIGWFGNVRCRKSLELLKEIVRRLPDKVEVVIRGRPSTHTLADLEAQIAGVPQIGFGGPYAQSDLARLYGEVHFAWSLDFTDEGLNSDWLLPNRIYEGSFFNTPSIAEHRTAIGQWLRERAAGLLVHDPLQGIVDALEALTPQAYEAIAQRTRAIDTRDLAFDAESCARLVLALGNAAHPRGAAIRAVAPRVG